MPQQLISQIIIIVILIAVFYFLLIRPQVKRQRERAALIAGINKGDRIVTLGGIVGVVVELKDDLIMLETGKNVILEMTKSAIAQKLE